MTKQKPKSLNKKVSIKNRVALCCTFLSFILFVPGISLSMLTLHSSGTIETCVTSDLSIEFFKSSNSILNSVKNLFNRNNKFVACMIFFFSVVVPVVKALLFSYVLLSTKPIRKKIFNFIKSISKWAMCDVFVVATFLAYLSSSSANRHSSREIMLNDTAIDIDVYLHMTAQLGTGFYCFLAYCLLALMSFQLYDDGACGKPPPLLHKH
jgi:hypothetical protein